MQIKPRMRYYLTLSEQLLSKTQQTTSVGEDVDKREPLCTADRNVNWYTPTTENSMEVPQKSKNRTTI